MSIVASVENPQGASFVSPSRGDPRATLRRSLELVTWAWVFGAAWQAITTGTPLTVFAQGLHASPLQFGILTALPFLASLASLPASLFIDGTGRRKGIFLIGLYLQRFMWIPIALVPLWILFRRGPGSAPLAMLVFLSLTFIMHCGQGIGGPAWISWMADIVPTRICGKYFSRRRQWAMITAIPTALAAGIFLDRAHSERAQLNWCAILFLSAAVIGAADITMFLFLGEKPRSPQAPAILMHSFARPLRDKRFLLFAAFVGALMFALNLTGQFTNLYLLDVVKADNVGVQVMLFVAPMIAQLLVLPVWGAAADRVGIRPLLTLAALGLVPVGLGWCFLSPADKWLGYLLTGLGAALWTGVEVANFNFVIEFANGDQTAGGSYIAVNMVIINIAGCMGGLSAGVLAQLLNAWHWQPMAGVRAASFYDVLFVGSSALRVLAVLAFFPFLHEPTAHSVKDAARFMLGSAGSGVASASRWTMELLNFNDRLRPPEA